MNLYDEGNPLLRSRPFWEEEEEPVVPPVQPVAPPAAPELPEVEGEGYASPEEAAGVQPAPSLPEVEGEGYDSPEEAAGLSALPEVEGEGYATPEEAAGGEESFLTKAFRKATEVPAAIPFAGQLVALAKPETAVKTREFADKAGNAVRRGWLSGDVAIELTKPHPNLEYVAQQQRIIDTLKPDKDFETTWSDEVTPKQSLDAFLKDPLGNITQLFADSLGTMVRTAKDYAYKIPERAWQGTVGGAGIGGAAGGLPGAVAGAGTGLAAGIGTGQAEMQFAASKASEYASSIMGSLQEAGIDIKNADQLKKAFTDPQMMAEIRAKAERKAVPIAFTDALSSLVGGKMFAPAKTVGKKAVQWGLELLAQMGLAGGGEIGGQVAESGKVTSWRSVLAEIGMEPITGGVEVGAGKVTQGISALTAVPPAVAAPPAIPSATIAPPPPPGAVSPVVPPGVVPPAAAVPPVVPAGAAVPPVIPPVTPVPPVVPPVLKTPDAIEPGVNTPAGAAVTQEVGKENLIVKEVADAQAQNLQASNAPKTAQAIQQVASRSNAGATVSAAEFLEQAKVQAAEAAAQAAPPAVAEAPAAAPAPVIPAIPATPPAAPAPRPYGVPPPLPTPPEAFAPPAAAPAAAPAPAAPAAPRAEPKAAVVVGGQVFTGPTREEAVRSAYTAVGTDAMGSAETGWVDPDTGRFVSHDIYVAHQGLNAAIEAAGGNMEAPGVAEAGARLAEAQERDAEINNQIIQPGGEQVVTPGIKGQEALVATRPSQELAVPLAGVTATVKGVDAQGRTTTAQRPAAQALNDARNDKTALTLLLDCLI